MNVSIIGAGNLAWHLAPALDNTDFAVKEVYSRNPKNASALVERLYQARVKADLDFSDSPSRVFIVAVADDAIEGIAQRIRLPDDAILAHTSGAQPLSALGYAPTPKIGVFYPLQTFTKGKKVDFREIHLLIESENRETESVLMAMARAVSKNTRMVSSADRKAIHVAAVFASNFTNHMLRLAREILAERKLSLDVLKPLIAETINKSFLVGPENAQTGPARRGDVAVLDNHFAYLQKDEQVAEIYRVISQHILDTYDQATAED